MFRPFMKTPASLTTPPHNPITKTQPSPLLRLPTHVLDLIFDALPVLDRCTTALTCKTLLSFSHRNEHLDYIITQPPTLPQLQYFFHQLSLGWIPHSHLRHCPDCGQFRSLNPHYWRHVSEKYTRELVGRVAHIWRQRREDGWLRYWIERWCDDGHGEQHHPAAAVAALRNTDTTELLCPKCAVLNPDTNEWRLSRLAARNERHATGGRGARRIVSPGMHSPYVAMAVQVNGGTSPDLVRRAPAVQVNGTSPDLVRRGPAVERRQLSGRVGGGRGGNAGLGIQNWI